MKRVGIIGGTFDPPHIGHLIVAQEVLHALQLDEVRFMPNHTPPHKTKNSNTTNEDRLSMLEYAMEDHLNFKIERIELERNGPSYTYDTMVLLKNREPDVDFYFIIGADMVEQLYKWYKIDELVKIVKFVGVHRPNYQLKTQYPIKTLEIPSVDISSSMIRKRIENGWPIKYYVHEKVLYYIKKKGLYGS